MPDHIDRAQRVRVKLAAKGYVVEHSWVLYQVKRHAEYVNAGGGTDDAIIDRLVDCILPLVRKK